MQFVIFKLGEEHLAVGTDKILSISNMMIITRVSKAPDYTKGLINLRGNIKSLVDVNPLLNIESKRQQNNIIMLKIDEEEIGISIDEVEEAINIDEDKLQRLETRNTEAYIKGVTELEEKLLTAIDIEKLLNY